MLHHTPASLPTSTDLRIITTYLGQSSEPKIQPRNLSELSDIIKNRLATKGKDREQTMSCREWLKEKGMNIQPLIEYLSYKTTKEPHISQDNQPQQLSKFTAMQPILFNHQQYSEKALEYASANLLQFISTKRQFRKRQFKATLVRLGCGPREHSFPLIKPLQVHSPRDRHKRDKYIATLKRLLDAELQSALKKDPLKEDVENQTPARLFFEGIPHKLWKILFGQVKGVNFEGGKDQIVTEMIINSLRLVEEQFDEDLPVNKQAVTYYLQQKYLSKFEKPDQYLFHHQHGSLWGKAFLYFRAGRLNEAIELLQTTSEQRIARDIELSSESIAQKRPKKIRIDGMLMKGVSDVFRQQILYALGGQRKYSSDVLSDPLSLDCVWILLRNTGIHYLTDKFLFEEIRHQMIEFYSKQQLDRERIYFSSYLLDYDSLAKCSECELLDRDDLIHLLFVLQRYPSLVDNKEYLQSRLTEYAISYAGELAAEDREQYIYYLLAIPHVRLVEAASSLIVNSRLFSTIDWRKLMQYLPEDRFRSLLVATSEKYTVFTGNYLQAANTVVELILDRRWGLDMLTQMLIGHVKQKRIYGGEDITQALRMYSNWAGDQVEEVYAQLLQLLQNVVHISRALVDRNYRRVGDLLNSRALLFGEHFSHVHRQMLTKLLSFRGIEIFFLYLSSLMRAADIILTRDAHPKQLKQYKHSIYITANTVAGDQHFRQACQARPILELLEELSAGLIQNSMENYMNYN